jgi:DNA-binding NarL/FixJ family response regulator
MSRKYGSAKFHERYEASRHQTDRRRIAPTKEAAVLAMMNAGATRRYTAETLGISKNTVSAVVARGRKVTPEAA